MQKEEKSEGAVKWEFYSRYLHAADNFWTFVVQCVRSQMRCLTSCVCTDHCFLLVRHWTILSVGITVVWKHGCAHACFVGTDLRYRWVAFWTEDPDYETLSLGVYTSIYAALGILTGLSAYHRLYMFAALGIQAGRRLHNDLFKRIIHAPMAFFDTTPTGEPPSWQQQCNASLLHQCQHGLTTRCVCCCTGRIVSRFSGDLDQMDQQLSSQWGMLMLMIFLLLGMMIATQQSPHMHSQTRIVQVLLWHWCLQRHGLLLRSRLSRTCTFASLATSEMYVPPQLYSCACGWPLTAFAGQP